MTPDCKVDLVSFPDFDFVISCEVEDAAVPVDECRPSVILPEAMRLIGPSGIQVRQAVASANISRNTFGTVCFTVGDIGLETAGSVCVPAYNRYGLILAGWFVWVVLLNGAWQIVWVILPDCQDLMDPTSHDGWNADQEQILKHVGGGEDWCFEWEDIRSCVT